MNSGLVSLCLIKDECYSRNRKQGEGWWPAREKCNQSALCFLLAVCRMSYLTFVSRIALQLRRDPRHRRSFLRQRNGLFKRTEQRKLRRTQRARTHMSK